MRLKFIHPTIALAMRVGSIGLALANTVLAAGATLTHGPAHWAWASAYWPTLYGVSLVIHQAASTFGKVSAAI